MTRSNAGAGFASVREAARAGMNVPAPFLPTPCPAPAQPTCLVGWWRSFAGKWLLAAGLLAVAAPVHAAREAKARPGAATTVAGKPGEGELEPQRLLDKARELLQAHETERGVKMLESILEQYPKSPVRFAACLALGMHHLQAHEQPKAIRYLANLRALESPDGVLAPADRELFLEALYWTGVAHFQARQYGEAFPILRKITTEHPNTVWANQAYYYIGMCHFAQQNWSKAIEALSMVGTFVDPDSPTVQYIEAGRRFYVKVQDADLSVLGNLGKATVVTAETSRGDKDTLDCIPLGTQGDVVIGSIPTEVGMPKPADHVLQVTGGDTITVRYTDLNDEAGQSKVARESKVKVVSTGAVTFTLGDFETKATAAFLEQPLFVLLQDADLDATDGADRASVTLISRYKDEDAPTTGGVDIQKLLQTEEQKYVTRDQVTLSLAELGAVPAHSGRFGGKVPVTAAPAVDQPANQTDAALVCAIDDEIVVRYEDARHIGGETSRMVTAALKVAGEIDNRPRASQDVVSDPVIKAKKNLVEATAYLELARIFRSMGLMKGAKEKSAEGLERVEFIIRAASAAMPSALRQEAFKLKWELHIVAEDFKSAIATCTLFNRMFPDSPFADEALMGIGKIHLESKDYPAAIAVLRQVLALPNSAVKAEAQFKIAEATEHSAKSGGDAAIVQYKLCAERFPDSPFAGAALAKLVDYHIDSKDYRQAGDLLEQIFKDHPDATFLDGMLLKWVLVAYRSGDFQRAKDKCTQLLFEYPESAFAEKAKQILPQIEARLKK